MEFEVKLKLSVPLHAKQETVPEISVALVHPVMVVQTPVTKKPVEHEQVAFPLRT